MSTLIFLCVANAARSQMAEGLARARAPSGWTVHSAGSHPGTLHPLAVQVMSEIGIDIRHHRSKGLDSVPLDTADVMVTLCAEEVCPVTPRVPVRLHWPLPDPAAVLGSAEARLRAFRHVRDEIAKQLDELWKR